jgi:1-acyl-sn-glycerol-3-phosphate acyltransferase
MPENKPGLERRGGIPKIGDALPKRGNRLTQALAFGLMATFGWRLEGEVPDLSKMVLIGAPHTSAWDLLLTLATMFGLGVRFSWVAKKSLFKKPIGSLLRWLGGIPVDRQNSQGFVDQMAQEFERRQKLLLALMPEGTRSRGKEWKTGFYFLAFRAQVPILLITFDYGQKTMRIGPAVSPSGDIAVDLPYIQSFFANISGKHSS